MQSFFKKHFQLLVFRKLLGLKLGSHVRKSLHVTSVSTKNLFETRMEKENWVQNTLSDRKLGSYLEFSNRTNQFQTQIMTERGNPLLEPIERGNPLLELTRKMEE